MAKPLHEYRAYELYLSDHLPTRGESRGARSRLAQHLGCQTAFVSQVLNGRAHFTLEQGVKISDFLAHSKDESRYFMLLLHLGRSGTQELRKYYEQQLEELLEKRKSIRERIQVKKALSREDQAHYYSHWYYAAIHVMLSVPRFQTVPAIAAHLGLPLPRVSECLEFLASLGLAIRQGERYRIGDTRIHLGRESHLLPKHHTNWRMRAIQSLDVPAPADLHYSSVISLSEEDARKINGMCLDLIERSEPILRASKEEAVFSLSMDFFRV